MSVLDDNERPFGAAPRAPVDKVGGKDERSEKLQGVEAALAKVGLFADCDSEELAHVAALVTARTVPAGEVLTGEGAVGQEFFIITEGHAQVERNGTPLGILGPGAFVGELSLLDRGLRSATVSALTDLSIWAVGYREFHRLLETSPSIEDKVRAVAAARRAQDEFVPGLP